MCHGNSRWRRISFVLRRTPVALAAALLATSAQAIPGDLDLSFGAGGKVITGINLGGRISALVLQADRKILAAGVSFTGQFPEDRVVTLARYNQNGSLDDTFGNGGSVTTDLPFGGTAAALALQPEGKILIGGTANVHAQDFALVRYNTDGTLDPSFGESGKVVTDFGFSNDAIVALTVQPSGKILAVGSLVPFNFSDYRLALARYNADGTLDTSFGDAGKTVTEFGPAGGTAIHAATFAPDGKIIVAGTIFFQFALARYNADGSLDQTFGATGRAITDLGRASEARSVALQADGKIVAAGCTDFFNVISDFALARYHPNGSLDMSFGGDGKVTTDFEFGFSEDRAFALVLQADGAVIAAGTAHRDFALARYRPDGTLDGAFGSDGKMTTDFVGKADGATAIALQPDGKAVVGGSAFTTSDFFFDWALARYEVGVIDQTPPVITVPDDVTTDATGPSGAVVNYLAWALDEVDGPVAVTCSPPSGSVFPIGTTTVECTAVDASDNRATANFSVHVKGAAEQLHELLNQVISEGLGPGASLASLIQAGLAGLSAGNQTVACHTLAAFVNELQAQSGKTINPAQANQLIARANQIKAVLGCP